MTDAFILWMFLTLTDVGKSEMRKHPIWQYMGSYAKKSWCLDSEVSLTKTLTRQKIDHFAICLPKGVWPHEIFPAEGERSAQKK